MDNDAPLQLDLENPHSTDVRFASAYRAWWTAALASHQAFQDPNLNVLFGVVPAEFGSAVDLDLTWHALGGDVYRQEREASTAGLILNALAHARAAWSLPATLHLDAQEDPDPAESLRFRPAEELASALEEEAVRQYTDHLQGRSVGEVGRALTKLFLHTPEVLTGKSGAIVRMLVPADSDRDRKPRSQAELMHTEHPDLVEAEQRAQGYRHLTVVHGASGEEALPPTEVTTLKVLLNMFAGSPPPYYIGYGADRVVLVVGGPHADRTTVMVEGLIRAISPKTRGGGMADPDWEITRRFSPGEHPPELYLSNDTPTSGEGGDTP